MKKEKIIQQKKVISAEEYKKKVSELRKKLQTYKNKEILY